MRVKITVIGLLAAGIAVWAAPVSARSLKVSVDSFKSGGTVPNKYAFCVPAAQGHTAGGQNINPSISWSKGPRGTKSYAIILYDTDSPAEHREMMNKEGVAMTAAIKRHNFYHWVLADIPPNVTSIKEGADFECPRLAWQAGNAVSGRRKGSQRLHQGHGLQRCDERPVLRL